MPVPLTSAPPIWGHADVLLDADTGEPHRPGSGRPFVGWPGITSIADAQKVFRAEKAAVDLRLRQWCGEPVATADIARAFKAAARVEAAARAA